MSFWPNADDYRQAISNFQEMVADEELRGGQPVLNSRRKAMLWSGSFAAVFRIHCPATGNDWALKCFTREVPGQRERYRQIAAYLDQARLPFTVDFQYLENGVCVRKQWFPALKMRWVEGLRLNEFVQEHLERPRNLNMLLELWVKLAARLREANIAHADLQHGNVLLVPQDNGALALRLIDYDGMHVPSLSGTRSGELGHPAYQHPQRLREETYNGELDRFSHLVIYTSVRCLSAGQRDAWRQFNNGDNLLFRESDFAAPERSPALRALWQSGDREVRALVGRLALACGQRLEEVPWLDQVLDNGRAVPLSPCEEKEAAALLAAPTPPVPPGDVRGEVAVQPPPLPMPKPAPAATGTLAVAAVGTRQPRRRPEGSVARLDGFLRRLVGADNDLLRYFLWVVLALLPLAAVLGIVLLLQPKPHPATFAVVVDPPQAEVALSGKGASIEGSDADRTITVAEPDGQAKVTVVARLAGHKTLVEELQPKPGESRRLTLHLIEKRPAEAAERIGPPLAIAPFDDKAARQYQSDWAAYLNVPVIQTNSIGMKLALIPPGEFQMGSPKELIEEELKRNADDPGHRDHLPGEEPRHRVRITKAFWLDVTDVTQEEYQRVMGVNPSEFSATGQHQDQVRGQDTKRFPVEHVSWNEAVDFCRKLSELPEERSAGRTYCLLSEAQWEYACRAGNMGPWCFSAQPNPLSAEVEEKLLGEYAWFGRNADHRTHAVGQKRANAWGLFDMYGNVWQWCQDRYDGGYYAHSPTVDPTGPNAGSDRVGRGGSWIHSANHCRSAYRDYCGHGTRDGDLGLRVSLIAADGVAADGVVAEKGVREPAAPHDKVVKVVKKVVKVVSAMPGVGVAKNDVRDPAAPRIIQDVLPQIVQAGKPLSVTVVVEDAQRWKGSVRYSLASDAPPGARIDPQSGEFTWTPPSTLPAGPHRIGVCATGPDGQTTQTSFVVTVTPRNPLGAGLLDKPISVDLGYGVKLEMLPIPPGEFLMGSPHAEKAASSGEKPQHRVRISKPFYLGKYPVTQAQWQAVMGGNPSNFKGPQNPVEEVSWEDCRAFLGKLSAMVGRSQPGRVPWGGGEFRLPSEAQWEYACRAGSTTRYCFGDEEAGLREYAWYDANSGAKTHPVGEKKPNDWGLYDMQGNVWELCQDWHDEGYYAKSPPDDPTGPATGASRVFRGGGWSSVAWACRTANRGKILPRARFNYLGLRVSLVTADK